MPASTKYRGTALYVIWIGTGGTVDLTGDSRVFTVPEEANQIDVTTRGDTAKRFLTDFPSISPTLSGLDGAGSGSASWLWDTLSIGDSGTLRWGPEGTASGYRRRTMPAIVKSKNFNSPYDGAVEWTLGFDSNGGTVTKDTW